MDISIIDSAPMIIMSVIVMKALLLIGLEKKVKKSWKFKKGGNQARSHRLMVAEHLWSRVCVDAFHGTILQWTSHFPGGIVLTIIVVIRLLSEYLRNMANRWDQVA